MSWDEIYARTHCRGCGVRLFPSEMQWCAECFEVVRTDEDDLELTGWYGYDDGRKLVQTEGTF